MRFGSVYVPILKVRLTLYIVIITASRKQKFGTLVTLDQIRRNKEQVKMYSPGLGLRANYQAQSNNKKKNSKKNKICL